MPAALSGNLIVLCCVALWATSFPVTELLLDDWHPLPLVAGRLALSALALLALTVAAGQAPVLRRVPWRDLTLVGALGLGVSTTLLVWGQAYSNPVTVAIIVTTLPLASAIMGLIDGHEKVTAMILLGVAAAMAGGVLASLPPGGASPDFRGGEVLVLGSVIGFTWFSRASVFRLAHLPDIAKTAVMMAVAAVVVALATVVAIAAGSVEARFEMSLSTFGLFVWLGCAANGASMLLWLVGARRLGVTVAAIHLNAVPFYVMLLAVAIGDSLYMSQVWGGVLVALGALLAQLPGLVRRRRTPGLQRD